MTTSSPEQAVRPARDGGAGADPQAAPLGVIGASHPLTGGAAPFNDAMVRALRRQGPVTFLSWRRMYPPLLYRGQPVDGVSRPPGHEGAERVLDWHNPLTWRAALDRLDAAGARALVIPWLHPVMAPPTRWLLRHAPARMRRVVICHNVLPHERTPFARRLLTSTLRHADLIMIHAEEQRGELAELGLADRPVVSSFHPVFVAGDLAPPPAPERVAAVRREMASPDLVLLCFGAIRPYKGVDLAIEAMGRVDPGLAVRLIVAGRFWIDRRPLETTVDELGLRDRVELRDGYVSNEDAAALFEASDAAILPYRSASQSGVVGLAFAHGKPVIATSVGGLPEAVRDGEDGLLCPPGDAAALARAIEEMARRHRGLAAGVEAGRRRHSFDRYATILNRAIAGL